MSEQITSITLCKYSSLREKLWAFNMMAKGHKHLKVVPGMQFYKLMGSGSGLGFNFYPDWGVYSLLQIWDTEPDFNNFYESSELIYKYQSHTDEMITILMKPIKTHGLWSGKNPFHESTQLDKSNQHISVITRATIKTSKLVKFWRYVPTSQKPIKDMPGLIFTKGIGEVPIKQMATFSIWENEDALNSFAYQSKEHSKAIKLTRDLNWYSEELFARFQPYKTIGEWTGINLPL